MRKKLRLDLPVHTIPPQMRNGTLKVTLPSNVDLRIVATNANPNVIASEG